MVWRIKWFSFLIASLFLLAACSANKTDLPVESAPSDIKEGTSYIPEEGLHSPEDAVTAYLEGLRDMDMNRMIGTLPDDLPEGSNADEKVEDFIAHLNWLLEQSQSSLNPSEFKSLEVLGFIPPEELEERYASEVNQENLSNRAERAGVEQLVSRVVLFELGGETYMLIVDVADFGDEWRISQFGGNLGALLYIAEYMQGMIPPEFVDEFLEGIDLETVMISR